MKIDGIPVQNVLDAYTKNNTQQSGGQAGRVTRETQADSGEGTDRVEISNQASDMSEARSLTRDVPRQSDSDKEARIANIKSMIDSGQYSVPSGDVAKSILRGALLDRAI